MLLRRTNASLYPANWRRIWSYGLTPEQKGLGFVDPGTAAMALQTASGFVSKIESFFNIGAGRREADQIVPYQNDVHYNVLAPVASALEGDLSYNQLQSLYKALTDAETAWLKFLRETQWSDGRAATQAESTLAPIFSSLKSQLVSRLSAKTGGLFSGETITTWFPSYVPGLGPEAVFPMPGTALPGPQGLPVAPVAAAGISGAVILPVLLGLWLINRRRRG
jgi:hypothetical protein